MANSQNGWPASAYRDALGIEPGWSRFGVAFPGGVRGGPVGTVLGYVVEQFHQRVEPLTRGHCWGYAFREIRGQTSGYSNHASGTAIDINAPEHPLGRAGTFTPAQVRQIHAILAEAGRVVRWGGDYTGRKDEMHFEVVGSAAAIAAAAARLTGHRPPAPPSAIPPFPLPGGYYFGPRDGPNESISCMAHSGSDRKWRPDLARFQQRMIDRGWPMPRFGADGMYGESIAASEVGQVVLQFQKEKGLASDGLIGPTTWAAAWATPIT
jgi:hypothetical protein